jgi:hypothetical protein
MVLARVYLGFWLASVMYVHSTLSVDMSTLDLHYVQSSQKMEVTNAFLQNLLRREPLKLVDGGESQRTFVYIKDAIDAVVLMIVCYCLHPWYLVFIGSSNSVGLNSCFYIVNHQRKILLEPMVTFSMLAILTMKLLLGNWAK